VAAALRMPARTLQRRLAAEGTSLQREVEEIRKVMAVAVLRDGSVTIEDVAFLLGYSEPSTFFRSFKRWTGFTPAASVRAPRSGADGVESQSNGAEVIVVRCSCPQYGCQRDEEHPD
jgi:AraC-like DNA-binding protein